MSKWPAYEEFTLSHGFVTVRLRPSLRAVSKLESMHDGLEQLFRHVDEFNLATMRAIISACATDQDDASLFLAAMERAPLRVFYDSAYLPVIALCQSLIPQPDPNAKPSKGKGKPWSEAYRDLFRVATGQLHWTPDAAWSATPTEINEAYLAHWEMLKAVHGSGDNKPEIDPEQAAENEELGLDPEYDRSALHSLKYSLGASI